MEDKKFCPLLAVSASIGAMMSKYERLPKEIHDVASCSKNCAWYDEAFQCCSIKKLADSNEQISCK